jgi:hypothetical protein
MSARIILPEEIIQKVKNTYRERNGSNSNAAKLRKALSEWCEAEIKINPDNKVAQHWHEEFRNRGSLDFIQRAFFRKPIGESGATIEFADLLCNYAFEGKSFEAILESYGTTLEKVHSKSEALKKHYEKKLINDRSSKKKINVKYFLKVPNNIKPSLSADKFYDGFLPDWSDIAAEFDVLRSEYIGERGIK